MVGCMYMHTRLTNKNHIYTRLTKKSSHQHTHTRARNPNRQASSRSHSLLLVSVTTTDRATGKVAKGRLILVC